ncbi:MAG: ATP-binding protein [Bdellovibrionaceae bacterium]|nr:ATP-binding protein [Pseudobdellovibrionaceae bacterium]
MYTRLLQPPKSKSFFLFGPRGTGKTTWLRDQLKADVRIDLLDSEVYQNLLASPARLSEFITVKKPKLIAIDEIQRVPRMLDEVHRLIEEKRWIFALTGSSARKLRRENVNLLAGRALSLHFHPLTALELGDDFDLSTSLKWGHLPSLKTEKDKRAYLKSYVTTYVREEVLQEGFTRNIAAFSRFLEAASFSQGSVLNISSVAREASVERKVGEEYFTILEDILIGARLPAFQKKAKRRVTAHPKFYYFDVGVYRAIRPLGPLDDTNSVNGIALETLVYQELRAINDLLAWDFELSYWRAHTGEEVDFVLYGERGFFAIEVKLTNRIRPEDLKGLRAFQSDYPKAHPILLYAGDRQLRIDDCAIVPVAKFLKDPSRFIGEDL